MLDRRMMNDVERETQDRRFVQAYFAKNGNAAAAARELGYEGRRAERMGFKFKNRLKNQLPETQISEPDVTHGYFYIISLIPDTGIDRFKFGFSNDTDRRLEEHRTAAPTAEIVRQWPCKRIWEACAIDAISRGEKHIRTEVFDIRDRGEVLLKANAFFALLGDPNDS